MAMYPDFPEPPSKLLPLPLCDGPKLGPFVFKGPQDIEFLEYLGSGVHSHVVKVKIQGRMYALNLFVGAGWLPMAEDASPPSPGDQAAHKQHGESPNAAHHAFAKYCEPFNAECRAFGRLKETGNEDLAIGCFGYVLLSNRNEVSLQEKFKRLQLSFDGDGTGDICDDNPYSWRARFPGKDGKRAPIRGILKEFGQEACDLTEEHFEQMRWSIVSLQRLGIVGLDVHPMQFIDGKLADFSVAYTTPHFALNPELNKGLTPEQESMINFEAFRVSLADYLEFDRTVGEHNQYYRHSQKSKGDGKRPEIKIRGIPDTGRSLGPNKFYTSVNPRSYDWRLKKQVDREAPGKGESSIRSYPPGWIYHCDDAKKAAVLKRGRGLDRQLFQFKDRLFWPKDVCVEEWLPVESMGHPCLEEQDYYNFHVHLAAFSPV